MEAPAVLVEPAAVAPVTQSTPEAKVVPVTQSTAEAKVPAPVADADDVVVISDDEGEDPVPPPPVLPSMGQGRSHIPSLFVPIHSTA